MPSLKEVRNRIQSVNSTQQITKAMKLVAASKLRRAQEAITQMRPYAQKLTALLNNLSANTNPDELENVYAEQRPPQRVLLIPITSDRGLCGAFNTNVVRTTQAHIAAHYQQHQQQGTLQLMCIGRKGYDAFRKRGYQVVGEYANLFSDFTFDNARHAAEEAMRMFRDGEVDRVEIVYNEFKNVATQIMRVEQMLPIMPTEPDPEETANVDYLFEPSVEFIVEELIPKSLNIQLYKALLESNAAEHGARMTAMDSATENAGELLKELRLTYNRTRQAAITKEILEIVGGAEALAQGG
ncbi:F-type H+-transporting ATPase subunit gamma [Catalinimonas alkaloidigena]|uniref:ATP synthase gamma chain n=1 Tax=Catalinimonas alkaloidigena TaxID=1075417 RepID=A0A1G9E884_9BACT|nr:ATP synthase F1 subunit gamma [Catalinimonas alkaloidigena]SDK72373.1 F-type H+-transporting ATPase subunit gamma [Catalinimonas alkaloidigena]